MAARGTLSPPQLDRQISARPQTRPGKEIYESAERRKNGRRRSSTAHFCHNASLSRAGEKMTDRFATVVADNDAHVVVKHVHGDHRRTPGKVVVVAVPLRRRPIPSDNDDSEQTRNHQIRRCAPTR